MSILLVCVVGIIPEISFVAPLVFAVLLGSLMAFPTCVLPSRIVHCPAGMARQAFILDLHGSCARSDAA